MVISAQYPMHSDVEFFYDVKVGGTTLTHASGGVTIEFEQDGTNVVTSAPMVETSTPGRYSYTRQFTVPGTWNVTVISINPNTSDSTQVYIIPDAAA